VRLDVDEPGRERQTTGVDAFVGWFAGEGVAGAMEAMRSPRTPTSP
jgi:hypothetical protein